MSKLILQERAFCTLIANGFKNTDSYKVCFPKTDAKQDSIASMASRLAGTMSDEIKRIKSTIKGDSVNVLTQESQGVESRSQDDIMIEINQLINQVTDPKVKGQLLLKLSDLQKREHPNEEESKVVYYLPLTCHLCKYWQEKQEQRRNERLKQLKQKEEVLLNNKEDE